MNLSATLNVFRLLYNPKLCIPQLIIPTFNELPVPIDPIIKAVVLDKDNCFAYPDDDKVYIDYLNKWDALKQQYPGARLLIVSNSAGSDDDVGHKQAQVLEEKTGVSVLRHSVKKPGCKDEILEYFYKKSVIQHPSEVAVVGDRLFTDIIMANSMGAYGVWVKDGVRPSNNVISKFEKTLFNYLNF